MYFGVLFIVLFEFGILFKFFNYLDTKKLISQQYFTQFVFSLNGFMSIIFLNVMLLFGIALK
jgi:hypothetical protein